MKERDYINCTDLAKIIAAENILRDIVPENSIPVISSHDYRKVVRMLRIWRMELFAAVQEDIET